MGWIRFIKFFIHNKGYKALPKRTMPVLFGGKWNLDHFWGFCIISSQLIFCCIFYRCNKYLQYNSIISQK